MNMSAPRPEPELGEGIDPNAEIDLEDARIAWNFGTRELTEAEYEHFAALHHADYARWAAAEAADEAWRKAHPDPVANAQAAAEYHAGTGARSRGRMTFRRMTPEELARGAAAYRQWWLHVLILGIIPKPEPEPELEA
jgi:hypothetical protein